MTEQAPMRGRIRVLASGSRFPPALLTSVLGPSSSLGACVCPLSLPLLESTVVAAEQGSRPEKSILHSFFCKRSASTLSMVWVGETRQIIK